MDKQDLTQYLFYDGHEVITNRRGKVVALRDPSIGAVDYVTLPRLRARYVQGSIPRESHNSLDVSREPRKDELLLTSSWFLGLFQTSSISMIKQIDQDFQFPDSC